MHSRANDLPSDDAPSPDAATAGPRTGDVLITEEPGNPSTLYLLQQKGQDPQLSCTTRDIAETVAINFARKEKVDVWRADGRRFTLVERFRRDAKRS